jgi:hypothetical protein
VWEEDADREWKKKTDFWGEIHGVVSLLGKRNFLICKTNG